MTKALGTTNIIIIMRISRASICCTRWECRALYNNTSNTHSHKHTSGRGIGTAMKKFRKFLNRYRCVLRAAL